MALGFWMNNKNCYGCKTCSIACKSEKQLNEGVLLRKVSCIRQDSPVNVSFLSMSCNHCEDPACVKACPVEAYTKLDNGIVKQDHDKCIGCKMCIEACPYNAPCYDEEESKTYKCDMCYDRQQRGELPACVAACPAQTSPLGRWRTCKRTTRPISFPTRTRGRSRTSLSRLTRSSTRSRTTLPWSSATSKLT